MDRDQNGQLASRPDWAPAAAPLDVPSVARMYDYYLGGAHNFAADRAAAEAAIAVYPDLPLVMQTNRAFLRRAVHFLIERGIDQFLDLGSGIPTVGNVHEVAQQANPTARVVYVDVDPVAVAHADLILRGNPRAAAIEADIREMERIFSHPTTRRLLDLDRPLAILLCYILHFLPDDAEAERTVASLRAALPSGSYLVISHGTAEFAAPAVYRQGQRVYARTSHPLHLRPREQVARYFDGLDMVPPGLVLVPLWRPETDEDLWLDQPERSVTYAGIGRKP